MQTITENKNQLKVVLINGEDCAKTVNDELGITKERVIVLMDLVKQASVTSTKHTDILLLISENSIHANELAFCCFMYGRDIGLSQNPIDAMLKAISNR